MGIIKIETYIKAPIERCFKLSTSIDLHKISTSKTKEEAIAGTTTGLIKLNETVTWRAKHLGLWFKMKVKITEVDEYHFFADKMVTGPFKFMKHIHAFEATKEGTLMKDTFEFSSPLGFLGQLVDKIILNNYMHQFLIERNRIIKEFAETDKWKQVL